MSNFWITQPFSAEETLEIIYKVAGKKRVSAIILDSLAALTLAFDQSKDSKIKNRKRYRRHTSSLFSKNNV